MDVPPGHLLRWLLSFAGYPLGGLLVVTLFRVGGVATALLGGLLAGAVLGAVQWVAGRPLGLPRSWIAATSAGLGLGSGLAALLTGTSTSLAHLAVFGAVQGTGAGAAQGLAVTREPVRVAAWAAVVSGAWAVGWSVTTAVGVDVERGYVVFGSSGALAATVVTGLAMPAVLRPTAGVAAARNTRAAGA